MKSKEWAQKTFSLKKDTIRLLESIKKKKKKSYDAILKELILKEKLKKKKEREKIKGLIYDLLGE
jgi:hypothetical protein